MVDTTDFLESTEYLKLNKDKSIHTKYFRIFSYLRKTHAFHDSKEIEKATINTLILHLRNI